MAVIQTADKIPAITIAAILAVDVAGMEIHKDMLKQQSAVGKTVDTALPEVGTMMMIIAGTADHPEATITIMKITTEGMVVAAVVPKAHHTTMITVAEVIPVVVITTMMTTTEDPVRADGLVTPKDMQKLHVVVGKKEVDPTAAVVAMAAVVEMVAVVTDVTIVTMMITTAAAKVAVGSVIQKGTRKQQNAVGKIVDTNNKMSSCKKIVRKSDDLFIL
jgi:hypothetical protein